MLFRTLGLCLLFISTVSFAQGRKPAVEDFVGIEIEQPEVTPQGTESLYNLEQALTRIETQKKSPSRAEIGPMIAQSNWNVSMFFGMSLIVGFPLMIWFMVMNHLKKKALVESASNIEMLEKYRKEREIKSEQKIRKAS